MFEDVWPLLVVVGIGEEELEEVVVSVEIAGSAVGVSTRGVLGAIEADDESDCAVVLGDDPAEGVGVMATEVS